MGLLIHGAMVQGLCHDESFMEHSLECCYAAVIRWVSVKVSVGVISWQELHGALSGALSCCSHEQCMKRINIRGVFHGKNSLERYHAAAVGE